MRFSNGDVYKGSFINNLFHGKGVLKHKTGEFYSGN